ncbi:hypothetical protein QQY66_01970 [Streptomyces sp. DG2A-72]|uniref:hypothetical protein n=1 Tax=Streptomyces sp. DG2A-72 TaxID=3051386 RepID=UPI00265C787C|nr:hypothetical protein [Streptomyces sp. DG2A-72]MDO0930515.1 hypothetical protein [Streptomyces sp. DG2A-72]
MNNCVRIGLFVVPVVVYVVASQERLHILTAHEQSTPLTAVPAGSEQSLEGGPTRAQRLRARLSRGFHGEGTQIPKPTEQEYKEISSLH